MASIVKVPQINSIPNQDVNAVALTESGELIVDAFIKQIDNENYTIKRPGLRPYVKDIGGTKKIDGLYYWPLKKLIIAVSRGQIFKINFSKEVTDITGDELLGEGYCTFADNGDFLVIANGGQMVFTDGVTPTQLITDVDAPTEVTHLVFLDDFLLTFQRNTGVISFADFTNAPTGWNTFDFFSSESNPDELLALYNLNRTLIAMGRNSIEFFVNDGFTPFSRLNQTLSLGVMSPYSTVNVNGVLYFFDDRRRLNRLTGSTPTLVNTSFDELIQSFQFVGDTAIHYVTYQGRNWIIIIFPTEEKTLFYDLDTNYWGALSYWDPVTANRENFLGITYAYVTELNLHLWGSRLLDDTFTFDDDFFLDDENEIHMRKVTGWIDHDVSGFLKRLYYLDMRFLTGQGQGEDFSEDTFVNIRYRKDGKSEWSNTRRVNLRNIGKTRFKRRLFNFGTYYSIQFEITFSDQSRFIMGNAEAKIDKNEF